MGFLIVTYPIIGIEFVAVTFPASIIGLSLAGRGSPFWLFSFSEKAGIFVPDIFPDQKKKITDECKKNNLSNTHSVATQSVV